MTARRRTHRPTRRRGFSFVELLFAMAVLSFGLLGIGAALYVGVGQTQTTMDETAAAAVGRQAAAAMSQLMTGRNSRGLGPGYALIDPTSTGDSTAPAIPPDPANLAAATDPTSAEAAELPAARPAYVCEADPRYAWVPMVRRTPGSGSDGGTADVLIAVLHAGARSTFGPADLAGGALTPPKIGVSLRPDGAGGATVALSDGGSGASIDRMGQSITTGTYLVLCGAPTLSNGTTLDPLVGLPIRLSELVGPNTWTIEPTPALQKLTAVADGYDAFLFGRGWVDPADATKGYAGEAQCVAVYATTVFLK